MITVRKLALIGVLLCTSLYLRAQQDSLLLSYEQFIEQVARFHPIAQKAELQLVKGQAEKLRAKGNLDPMISSGWNEKNFNDKLYYRQFQGELNIPTKLGIDIVGGYENTEGVFLNPENKTDEFGLWYLGLEANLLQGLWVNERRMAFKQADLLTEMSEFERQVILNELLYNASSAYLKWQQFNFAKKVYQENIAIASTYFENTKLSFENGEKTALDTLEALIYFQDATTLFQKNEIALIKARQEVENFLWFKNDPIGLQPSIQPDTIQSIQTPIANPDLQKSIENNPGLQSYRRKQGLYEIEQRLKREKLKPKLKVKYNPLISNSELNDIANYSMADFKWGVDFSMPLLFRKERADIQKGAVKIEEITLDIENKRNEIKNKLEGNIEQQEVLRDQIALSEINLKGYKKLLEGEFEKFNYGESSIFLLNKRQEKYINGQLKNIDANTKLQNKIIEYLYLANLLQ